MSQAPTEIPEAVAESVSDARDVPIEELPPLADVIDPDGLDAILSMQATDPVPEVMVTFRYAGARVFAHPGEQVDARPIHGE